MADESEIDRLDPLPTEVKLVSGFLVHVVRLHTRQLFRLMRIISRGASPQALAKLDFSDDSEEGRRTFGAQLLGIIVTAIPDAENETIGFLQSMTKPAGLVERKAPAQLTKDESKANEALLTRFSDEMFNPELEDTLSLLEAIIVNEGPDIQALGKKLQHLWGVARKALGSEQPETPEGAVLNLPEPTPPSSTS